MALGVSERRSRCAVGWVSAGRRTIGAVWITSYWAASRRAHSLPTHRQLASAVASISPAVWSTYAQARAANPGAFASAADFANDDVITHASALTGLPVRIASGTNDPFHPGVLALAKDSPKVR
jgi:hypothetical protein